jgi:hypothetical protein
MMITITAVTINKITGIKATYIGNPDILIAYLNS